MTAERNSGVGILQRGAGAALVVAVMVAGAAGLAGCDDPAPPPTVIVNTPPADGGPMVLVTVMITAAFVSAAIAVVCAWGWASERRARRETERMCRDAEETVIALSGQPGTDRQLARWPE